VNYLTNVRDVPAQKLIEYVAKDLKDNQNIKMPEFAKFVKTGPSRERAPQRDDWWYIRIASIFRKVYVSDKVTVKALKSYYGGKKNRGVKPEKFYKASGKIIRVCLQDLEKIGFVKIADNGGRVLTKKGQSYLDKIATKLSKEKETKKQEKL
jgi:small subunit ribosomal protein S19e